MGTDSTAVPARDDGGGHRGAGGEPGNNVVLEGRRLAVASDGTDGREEVAGAVVDVAQAAAAERGAGAL